MCPKHILDMSGLNTRNEQLDSRVTEREKFHDGWDLNLIWFDYYYILILLLHIILNKIDNAAHFTTWPRLRCILTWNQDRLQLPIPCSIGSQGEFGWRSNEEQPGCHDLPRRAPTTWLLQGCAFYHLSCSMLPISYNYCQCRCPLQHCIDVIYRKIYQIYKMDLCGRCSGNHVALKGILSYKLLPGLYISVYHVCRLSPKLFSELFLCLRPAWFCISGVEQPSVERNLVKRRSLCGAFWQASISAAGVFSTGWFNYGASHQSVGHSNILNILFVFVQSKTVWKNSPASHGTISLDVETSTLGSRKLWSCEQFKAARRWVRWQSDKCCMAWSGVVNQPVLFSNLFKERRSKIWFVSVCSVCLFHRLARTTHGSATDQRGTSRSSMGLLVNLTGKNYLSLLPERLCVHVGSCIQVHHSTPQPHSFIHHIYPNHARLRWHMIGQTVII